MKLEQIRIAHHAAPFLPFTIRMADGRGFLIPHPDFLFLAPDGRTVFVANTDGSVNILDSLLMTEIEIGPNQPAPA
jgi:hypothetical protein